MKEPHVQENDFGAFVSKFERRGSTNGPLAGLTFGLKDLYDVAGIVTGAGNPEWARTHQPASVNAPVLDTLLGSGATLVGKTHTDELAYSLMGANAHYGTPTNPAAPDRVPGGSSSGSVMATAGGLVDFAIGTDTGGSIRLPAAFCGVFGFRPTHGRVSLDGAVPLAPSFDTCGWFARDMATMIRVAEALGLQSRQAATELKTPKRLATPSDMWALAAPSVRDVLTPMRARAMTVLGEVSAGEVGMGEAGFNGEADDAPLNPDGFDVWRDVFRICQGAEIWEVHGAWVSSHTPRFGPGVRERFEAASQITSAEAKAAREKRGSITGTLDTILSEGVVLAFPTSPGPAPLRSDTDASVDAFRADALSLLCCAGLAGLPQITIPAGTLDGAPVGFSLMGARGTDRELLDLAALMTGVTGQP